MSNTKPVARAIRARISPAFAVVISLWGILFVLSLYNVQAIRDEVGKVEWLQEQEWVDEALTQAQKLSDRMGMGELRSALGDVRAKINTPYTVWERVEVIEDLPPEEDPMLAPVSEDALPHQIAPRPRRVLLIGASSMQFWVGHKLEARLGEDYEGVKVNRYGQLATGLTRPDFMDWPAKLRSLAESFKPDLVICNFGGNDAQSIPKGKYKQIKYGTPEWDEEYGRRVTEIIDIGREYNADTVMIGMPIMRREKFSAKMRHLNRLMKAATEDAGMLFVETYEKASGADGKYRRVIKVGAKKGLMRLSDGVHYTPLGGQFITGEVMKEVERRYRFVPIAPELALSARHGFESPTLDAVVWYTAYVPRDQEGPRSALVLLPDAEWMKWPQYPHRELQRWAQENGVVIVVPEAATQTTYVGPFSTILRDELSSDLKTHLSVDTISFAGSGRGAVSALASGRRAYGLLLYQPWIDPSEHADDEALSEALGAPAATTGAWGTNGWASRRGPPVWLQADPEATALRRALGDRLREGRPASSFLGAIRNARSVLIPPAEPDTAPERGPSD